MPSSVSANSASSSRAKTNIAIILESRSITLANCCETARSIKESEDAYRSALAIQDKLAKQTDNQNYQQELSRTLNNFGILLMDTDRPQRSRAIAGEGARFSISLARDYPDRSDYQQELARTNINLGKLFKKN